MKELNDCELLTKWEELKALFDLYKKLELEYRKEIMSRAFKWGENQLRKGTEILKLDDKRDLKAVFKINRRIDKDSDVEGLIEYLSQHKVGIYWVKQLFKSKIELSDSTYNNKNLPNEIKTLVDEILIESPALPNLSIVRSKKNE